MPGALLIEDERIVELLPPGAPVSDAARIDLDGAYLAPGFIDLHFHGSAIFAAPGSLGPALALDSASLARFGTTSFLSTTVALPATELSGLIEEMRDAFGRGAWPGARPLGVHLEGPWINTDAPGAQPPAGIRPYDSAEGREIFDRGDSLIRMITLAPEIEGADDLLKDLEKREIVPALGHTRADRSTTERGVAHGIRHVTHLFNAMPSLHHRDLGATGVALSDDELTCDLICDGVHVDPGVVVLAARAKRDRLILITDRLQPPAGEHSFFGAGRLRDEGGALRMQNGTLAGSLVTLDRALANAQEFGAMSLLEAVAACTLRPAKVLGIEATRGTLRRGSQADLTSFDVDGKILQTWLAGKRLYPTPNSSA